jgi:branched-chain amino acid transport system permease protein
MDLASFLIQCLNAVQYGLLLFLVAAGLTLIFGIMGVINLAHGSFYMMGAYLAYGLAPWVNAQTPAAGAHDLRADPRVRGTAFALDRR